MALAARLLAAVLLLAACAAPVPPTAVPEPTRPVQVPAPTNTPVAARPTDTAVPAKAMTPTAAPPAPPVAPTPTRSAAPKPVPTVTGAPAKAAATAAKAAAPPGPTTAPTPAAPGAVPRSPTGTRAPATAPPRPPTATRQPPTATPVPPTATARPPSATPGPGRLTGTLGSTLEAAGLRLRLTSVRPGSWETGQPHPNCIPRIPGARPVLCVEFLALNVARETPWMVSHLDFTLRDAAGRTHTSKHPPDQYATRTAYRLESVQLAIPYDVPPAPAGLSVVYKPAFFPPGDEWVFTLSALSD